MKIALIGTHGTGKTTLAKEISKRLNIPYIPETAVEVNEMLGLPLYPNSTAETQFVIFINQLMKEYTYDEGVFDRCLLDNIAYSSAQDLNEDIIDAMANIARVMAKKFDFIFLVTRFTEKIEDNGYRDTGLLGQMDIEHIILILLQSLDLKYYLIYERDLSTRIEKIIDIIENFK